MFTAFPNWVLPRQWLHGAQGCPALQQQQLDDKAPTEWDSRELGWEKASLQALQLLLGPAHLFTDCAASRSCIVFLTTLIPTQLHNTPEGQPESRQLFKMLAGRCLAAPARQVLRSVPRQQLLRPAFAQVRADSTIHVRGSNLMLFVTGNIKIIRYNCRGRQSRQIQGDEAERCENRA